MGYNITERCYVLGKEKKKRMVKEFSLKKANMIETRQWKELYQAPSHTHSFNSHSIICVLKMRRVMSRKKTRPKISTGESRLELALITPFYF